MDLATIALIILVLPLAAFVVQIFFNSKLPRQGDWLPTSAMGIACFASWFMFLSEVLGSGTGSAPIMRSWEWLSIGFPAADVAGGPSSVTDALVAAVGSAGGSSLSIRFGIHVDNLTKIMLVVVTTVSFLVHLYSTGYMRDHHGHPEDRYGRFFAFLALFSFSMIGLVLADSIFFLFIFWELVGVCSYFLIGFYFTKQSACHASMKAFLTTKLGDLGFMIGIMIIALVVATVPLADLGLDDRTPETPTEAVTHNEEVYHSFSFAKLFESIRPDESGRSLWTDQTYVPGEALLWGIGALIAACFVAATTAAGLAAGVDRSVLARNLVIAAALFAVLWSLIGGWIPGALVAGALFAAVIAFGFTGTAGTARGFVITGVIFAGLWILVKQTGLATEGVGMLPLAAIMLFIGAVGKSAQFPLHVWLPNAMEGPTPVSALIHAATMVVAGVYLVGRCFPFFAGEAYFDPSVPFYLTSVSPLFVVAMIGAITAFMAATIAIVQTDIKAVLAYSTISQLGFMMIGIGVGSFAAGFFHLWTHAFFKALLFLGAGSVIHAVGTNEMTEMGGLRKKMPITFITFTIATMAISGVPFLSGFYSKEGILIQALAVANAAERPIFYVPFVLGATAAAMTAFYMFRIIFLTFVGTPRNKHRFDHAHESPMSMAAPLMILATLSVFSAGFFGFGSHWFPERVNNKVLVRDWLDTERAAGSNAHHVDALGRHNPAHAEGHGHAEGDGEHHVTPAILGIHPAGDESDAFKAFSDVEHGSHLPTMLISLLAAGLGIFGCYAFFAGGSPRGERISGEAGGLTGGFRHVLVNLYFIDKLYYAVFVDGVLWIRHGFFWFDRNVIDRTVNFFGDLTKALARAAGITDARGVDGSVMGISRFVGWGGAQMRRSQTGVLQEYFVGSVVVLAVILLIVISFGA